MVEQLRVSFSLTHAHTGHTQGTHVLHSYTFLFRRWPKTTRVSSVYHHVDLFAATVLSSCFTTVDLSVRAILCSDVPLRLIPHETGVTGLTHSYGILASPPPGRELRPLLVVVQVATYHPASHEVMCSQTSTLNAKVHRRYGKCFCSQRKQPFRIASGIKYSTIVR